MVLSRGLVISLGVTVLCCTLLFLYFRNKISSIENKVSVIFDLIQNHQPEMHKMDGPAQFIPQNIKKEYPEENLEQFNNNENRDSNLSQNTINSLIEISDNASESDTGSDYQGSDDSLEVSDNEYEEGNNTISLVNAKNINLGEEIKKINVPLKAKEDLFPNQTQLQEVDVTDSLDEVVDDDLDFKNIYDQNSNNKSVDNKSDDNKSVDNKSVDNKLNIEENVMTEESNKQLMSDLFDYNKLRVPELKKLAEEKGLTNYKSLKKNPLIELLKSSE